MTSINTFRQLLTSCGPYKSKEEKVNILKQVLPLWRELRAANIDVKDILLECNLFRIYANVFEDNFSSWSQQFPAWFNFTGLTFGYYHIFDLFPIDQITALVKVFRKYMMVECWDSLRFFHILPGSYQVKAIVFNDDELYNKLKQMLYKDDVLSYFGNLAGGDEAWQHKILEDLDFIIKMLEVDNDNKCILLAILALHPEAKDLLPREHVLPLVTANISKLPCKIVYALLCIDDDLKVFEQDSSWVEEINSLLETLVSTGKAEQQKRSFTLLFLLLPVANLSVVDSYKALLGKKTIPSLMQLLVAEKLPETSYIQKFLLRGRQEASRALWNLAYLEANQTLIASSNGLDKLKTAMERHEDPITKKNIAGILHMFNIVTATPADKSERAPGHIMISYNWGNQVVVKRLSKSLKELGYKIWLDVEQMEGSVLEAMAGAVEQAEVVLICMSQRYKDSPNCRLEGEYCVNRRVPFIPLVMQKGYKPDGWLGITLGTKLYYNFSDENNWDVKITDLVKVIGNRGKEAAIKSALPIIITHVSTNSKTEGAGDIPKKLPLADWTIDDVHEWMKSEHIEKHFETFKKHEFTGRSLAELKRLLPLKPDFILTVCQQMGILEMGQMLNISYAVHKL